MHIWLEIAYSHSKISVLWALISLIPQIGTTLFPITCLSYNPACDVQCNSATCDHCTMLLYLTVFVTAPQHQKYLAFIQRLVIKVC